MEYFGVEILKKRLPLSRPRNRWRRRPSNKSWGQEHSIEKSVRRLQRIRMGRGWWSWRVGVLTAEIKNILFGLFQLRSVRCVVSTTIGALRETKKEREMGE